MSPFPPPERFGYPDVEWHFDPAVAPSLVAATFRQHRIVLQTRETWHGRLVARDAARRLAELRGSSAASRETSGAIRQIQRWMSGNQLFSLIEELEWCAAFGVRVEADGLADPAAYPTVYSRSLVVESSGAVWFAADRPPSWPTVVAASGAAIDDDLGWLAGPLLTGGVVRRHVVRALVADGLDPHLVQAQGSALRVLEPSPVTVRVVVGLDDSDDTYRSVAGAVAVPLDHDVLVLVAGAAPWARLRRSIPVVSHAADGTAFSVPAQFYDVNDFAMPVRDVEWRVAGRFNGAAVHVVALGSKR